MPKIAFYGSLMRSFNLQKQRNIQHQLDYLQDCAIFGKLYDLGSYPALTHGSGIVKAELYNILDPRVIASLDAYECYDNTQPKQSLYIRSCVRLASPSLDAYVYFYNQSLSSYKQINSGDWLAHHTQRS